MKENIEYLQDLRDVRKLMERSSKFISLSGVSGIMAGVYALICAYLVYTDILGQASLGSDYGNVPGYADSDFVFIDGLKLLGYGTVTLILALGTGIFLTVRKARRKNQKVFSKPAFHLFYNLLIPLVIGGLVCLVLILKGQLDYVAPLTLIFYGLALINASNFTFNDIRGLGAIQCSLGLLSLHFSGYSLLFWALGFGVAHIFYGIIMYFKYDKK